jgi:hypothetical protein
MLRVFIILFLILTFIGPISMIVRGKVNFWGDYRTANRDSAHLAPDPQTTPEAIVQVYTARAFNWHGLMSVHTWIATKPANAKAYTVYQVVGWRKFRGMAPLMIEEEVPDRNWFAQVPSVLVELRGDKAAKVIPEIQAAAKSYPYPNDYTLWPGPNSNTFTAYVLRVIPELHIELPANAVGKDYLPNGKLLSPAVSHTGYQFSVFGVAGMTFAKEEGLEINFLGMVYGLNPFKLSFKLPAIGEVFLMKPAPSSENRDSSLS